MSHLLHKSGQSFDSVNALQPYSVPTDFGGMIAGATAGVDEVFFNTGLPFPAVLPDDTSVLGLYQVPLGFTASQLCQIYYTFQTMDVVLPPASQTGGTWTLDVNDIFVINGGSNPFDIAEGSFACPYFQWNPFVGSGAFSLSLEIAGYVLTDGAGLFYPRVLFQDDDATQTVSTAGDGTGDVAGTLDLPDFGISTEIYGDSGGYGTATVTMTSLWPWA